MLRRIGTLIALALLALPLLAADTQSIKVLIITGDHGHAWKETTPFLKDLLTKAGMTRPKGRWLPNGRPEHLQQAVDGSLEQVAGHVLGGATVADLGQEVAQDEGRVRVVDAGDGGRLAASRAGQVAGRQADPAHPFPILAGPKHLPPASGQT